MRLRSAQQQERADAALPADPDWDRPDTWDGPEGPQSSSARPSIAAMLARVPIPALTAEREGMARRITAGWTAAGTLLYLVAPKAAPVILVLTLLAPLAWLGPALRNLRPHHAAAPVIAIAAAALYILFNAAWSAAPLEGLRTALMLVIMAGVLAIAIPSLKALDGEALRPMALGFYAGYVAAGAFLCVEALDGQAIHLALMAAFPDWQPDIRGAITVDGVYTSLPADFLNRNLSALSLMLWPAVLVAAQPAHTTKQRWLMLAGLVPAVAAVLVSHQATSKVAVAGGLVALALCLRAPRIGVGSVRLAWVVACLAAVPIVSMLYGTPLKSADWLFESARERIVMWGRTATQVAEAPVLGTGAGSARVLYRQQATRTDALDAALAMDTEQDSRNAYLQAWYETGLVGATLLLAVGFLVLRAATRMPPHVRPFLIATFASHALVVAFSYSLWAPWLLGSFALTAILALPAALLSSRAPVDGDTDGWTWAGR